MADTRRTRGVSPEADGGPSRPAPAAGAEDGVDVDVEEFERIGEEAEGAAAGDRAGSHVCSVAFCPISMALSAVEGAKPDAVEHLLAAGREFLLATKAVLDERAAQSGPSSTRLEKIDIG
jgi:hypothetical protein